MSEVTREQYSYSVLRYVHDIATGEFLNVGVVLFAPQGGFLAAKFKTTYGRVKKAFPSVNTDAFRAQMRRLQASFDEIAQSDFGSNKSSGYTDSVTLEGLAQSVVPRDDSSLQWSPTGGGLSKNLDSTLLKLYSRFVTKYDVEANAPMRKDDDVWKLFKTELEKRNVLPHLESKVISVDDDAVKFDHAWKNGVWHCYEPLSFDLSTDASIKEKAHKWLGQVSSISGGREAFHVYFLVGKPSDDRLADAYKKAVKILRKAPDSAVVEEDEAEVFSANLATKISKQRGTELPLTSAN